jgi:hypothetical protein
LPVDKPSNSEAPDNDDNLVVVVTPVVPPPKEHKSFHYYTATMAAVMVVVAVIMLMSLLISVGVKMWNIRSSYRAIVNETMTTTTSSRTVIRVEEG